MTTAALPPIAGREREILALVQHEQPSAQHHARLDPERIRSGFACALHMHQPTIPAGAGGELISHLQWMLEHPGEGDNHNAEHFAHCYRLDSPARVADRRRQERRRDNEFPEAFRQAHRRLASEGAAEGDGGTAALNATEYLDLLAAAGVTPDDFPRIQAVGQHRLWQQVGTTPTTEAVDAAIAELQASDPGFSMAGASWTNDLSWVEGYADVLEPMNPLRASFHRRGAAELEALQASSGAR